MVTMPYCEPSRSGFKSEEKEGQWAFLGFLTGPAVLVVRPPALLPPWPVSLFVLAPCT